MKRGFNKRGQVTIFIIAGVAVVAAALLFFLFRSGVMPEIGNKEEINPHIYFANCIDEQVRNTIEIMGKQGGYLANTLNFTFQFTKEENPGDISYLCYQQNYYLSCINQEPMLISHLKQEMKKGIREEVEGCFNALIKDLENKGMEVGAEYRNFDLSMQQRRIIIDVDGELTAEKSGETTTYSGLKSITPSSFYDLAIVAQEIVSQEARFCSFEQLGYMLLYPEYDIDKFRTGDSNTIYTIRHKQTQEMFRFAVRSCVIPPGF